MGAQVALSDLGRRLGIGFLAFYLAYLPGLPIPLPAWGAGLILVAGFVAAIGISTIHSLRRGSGVRPASALQGAIYGWSWLLGTLVVVLLGLRLAQLGMSDSLLLVFVPATSLMVCGLEFLAGAALWGDRMQLVMGAVLLVVAGLTLFVHAPTNLLLIAILLGGGFALCAVVTGARPDRRGTRD